ncbi:GDSL esterase lipase At5g33370-like [Olea europaea subsp. europaea]|uniref:GDSL esterase lipase At5g33370-like n=1 Tax=Olea europaea subsp. europaea TaxID=158383 RepID=A0A8S0R923_OLEEU|nr:GDSL esterase lipase At5g33370-like [Olea europaea subsp. europaea]
MLAVPKEAHRGFTEILKNAELAGDEEKRENFCISAISLAIFFFSNVLFCLTGNCIFVWLEVLSVDGAAPWGKTLIFDFFPIPFQYLAAHPFVRRPAAIYDDVKLLESGSIGFVCNRKGFGLRWQPSKRRSIYPEFGTQGTEYFGPTIWYSWNRDGECVMELQRAAALYHLQLTAMLSSLNSDLGADIFIAANTFEMQMNFISDPQPRGDAESFVCTRPLPTSDALPPLPTNVIFRPQGDDETETGVFFNWAWWLLLGGQRSEQGLNFSDVHNIQHESHFFFFVDFVAGPEKELIPVASPSSSVREGGDGNEEVGKGFVFIWAIFRED